jgi:hypothetical protein
VPTSKRILLMLVLNNSVCLTPVLITRAVMRPMRWSMPNDEARMTKLE